VLIPPYVSQARGRKGKGLVHTARGGLCRPFLVCLVPCWCRAAVTGAVKGMEVVAPVLAGAKLLDALASEKLDCWNLQATLATFMHYDADDAFPPV
jgi:hypothetical protein